MPAVPWHHACLLCPLPIIPQPPPPHTHTHTHTHHTPHITHHTTHTLTHTSHNTQHTTHPPTYITQHNTQHTTHNTPTHPHHTSTSCEPRNSWTARSQDPLPPHPLPHTPHRPHLLPPHPFPHAPHSNFEPCPAGAYCPDAATLLPCLEGRCVWGRGGARHQSLLQCLEGRCVWGRGGGGALVLPALPLLLPLRLWPPRIRILSLAASVTSWLTTAPSHPPTHTPTPACAWRAA